MKIKSFLILSCFILTFCKAENILPPEPDEKINNSTIDGIDANQNGIRDDVEIWIYETYRDKHPIYIQIALQNAKVDAKILKNPELALDIQKESSAAMDCEWYYSHYANHYGEQNLVDEDENIWRKVNKVSFNTKKRKKVYDEYDQRLSGHVFGSAKISKLKSQCDFDTSVYIAPEPTSLTLKMPTDKALKNEEVFLKVIDQNGIWRHKNLTWLVSPKDAIAPSNTNYIVPIKDTNITLQAKYEDLISNPITLNVKWIVRGHELPPEPDEKLNNSTLLGIDVNKNGVRDDVERWIYEYYKNEDYFYIDGSMDKAERCNNKLKKYGNIFAKKKYSTPEVFIKPSESKVESRYFNTKQRYEAYLKAKKN